MGEKGKRNKGGVKEGRKREGEDPQGGRDEERGRRNESEKGEGKGKVG